MAKGTRRRIGKPRATHRPTRIASGIPSLLILDCDRESLPQTTASFGAELETAARTFVPRARTLRLRVETTAELLRDLGALKTEVGHFDLIAVIGHSNERELGLVRDGHASWAAVAQWFLPFSPKRIMLVACQAGRWLPGAALFRGIPSLQEVYGSPVLVNDAQAAGVKLLGPYLLLGKRLTVDQLRMGQIVTFLLTHGIVLRRKRRDYHDAGFLDALAWKTGENLLQTLLRELRSAVSR